MKASSWHGRYFCRRACAALALFFVLAHAAVAEQALRGVALVIGQSDYAHLARLANPQNDARSLDRLLSDLGFEVDSVTDADRRKLSRALERFVEDAEDADVALIYYSGHGIEAGGENFLVPVDASATSLAAADAELVPVSALLARLQAAVPVTIMLLDACRSNPFPPGSAVRRDGAAAPVLDVGLGAPRGAAPLAGKPAGDGFGSLLGLAAAPGQAALDGSPGGNSPYAAALLKHLSASGFSFADVMTMVSEEVYLKTDARQVPWTNTSLRRQLYFGGSADAAGDADSASIRGERRKLLLAISSMEEVRKKQVVSAARQTDVPMDALFAMLRAVGADLPEDPGQVSRLLEEQANRIKALVDDRNALKSADPEIVRLSSLAGEAVREGALEVAIGLRERAKQRVAALSVSIDQAEADMKARRVEFASVFAASAETYVLAYQNLRAAEDFRKAFDQVERWDGALALRYKLSEARALSEQGFFKADNAALARSVDAFRLAAILAPPETDPAGWVESQSGLAIAMWSRGQRQSGAAGLEEAAAVLRAALAAPVLASRAQDRAQLQADLALVLMSIGQREGGTRRLEEAVSVTRQALEVETREAAPMKWARLQNHLGSALFLHGSREQSLDRIKGAADAFRAALTVWTADNEPLSWANAQNNLGLAIGQIGSREPGSEKLLEAVRHLKAALEVRMRDVAPLSWAETLTNLAATYYELGVRIRDQISWFELGATALRQAMEEITRERDPLRWSALQDNLGLALAGIGRRTGDAVKLREALAAYEQALLERTRERVPLDWASTMNNIGNVRYALGEFEHSPAELRAAVATFDAVLQARTHERASFGWARTQNNLANALAGLGEYEDGTDTLQKAVDHYRMALAAHDPVANALGVADTQSNLALTLIAIGKRSAQQADFDAARVAVDAAQAIYAAAGNHDYDGYFGNLRLEIEMAELSATIDRRLKELAK